MPQNTTDPLSALGLIRDPASGSWSYTPQNLPTLSAEELGSLSNPQLRAHVYEQAQVTDARNRDAQLGKQAAGLNYGEQSMAVSREALEGFGTEARRAIDASYQQQLAGIDPRMAGTTVAASQRGAATRDYRTASSDLERQIAQTRANVMRPELRNMQDLITERTDTGPDLGAIQQMLFESGASGVGSRGVDAPEWWEGPLVGAATNWFTTPTGPGQSSPLGNVVNELIVDPLTNMIGGGGGNQSSGLDYDIIHGLDMPPIQGAGYSDPTTQYGPVMRGSSPDDVGFLEGAWDATTEFVSDAGDWVGDNVGELIGGIGTAAKLTGTTLAGAGPAIAGGASAAGAGLAAAGAALAPIALPAAAIWANYEMWDHNREDIRRETDRLGEQIEEGIGDSYDYVEDMYGDIADTVGDVASDVWDDITDFFGGDDDDFWGDFFDDVGTMPERAVEAVGDAAGDVVDFHEDIFDDIGDEAERAWDRVSSGFGLW